MESRKIIMMGDRTIEHHHPWLTRSGVFWLPLDSGTHLYIRTVTSLTCYQFLSTHIFIRDQSYQNSNIGKLLRSKRVTVLTVTASRNGETF